MGTIKMRLVPSNSPTTHEQLHSIMETADLLLLAAQPIRPFETIPVIDISGLSGDAESRAKVASKIQEACIQVGLFYVKNHGVDENLITSTVDAARGFFDLSLEEKMKLDFHKTSNFRGYYPVNQKKYYHECFEIGPEVNTPIDGSSNEGNLWPSEDAMPGFQGAVLKYYHEIIELGMKLLSAFALALNLPEDYFADKVDGTSGAMRLIHYPPQSEESGDREPGIGAHTDFRLFTILWQDEVSALQVLNSSGQWVNAEPIPGTFVIKSYREPALKTNK
ncbi:unnamed protein product [Rhizoctonia solani]|uniref:Fe2OG dioxygenase domain-containing protein n=1 Tax=Rhizoctonia solani TaxID=456999 RepID=A0A8H3GT14_9AGAM|nr:unnamed protein product [Rhizoctonia solani]